MRSGWTLALWLLFVSASALPASAELFTADVHTTVTVYDTHYWSGIEVEDGGSVTYTVRLLSGDLVNVHLMDDARVAPFLSGSVVPTVNSEEDTSSSSYTHSSAGRYALMIDNGYGESVCKVDIVVRSPDSSWVVWVFVALVIVVIAAVAVVVVMQRRRPAARPQDQPGGPQQYPAQPAQYPAQPPAGPPSAPAQPAQCRYCDFLMPAGTQICPRCGGFN
ncbi:MAG: hypothetical protein FJ149_00145 [Euryarchaeota archaeon]|nr:hypothetical protein [Euryarchaeota archaeon]